WQAVCNLIVTWRPRFYVIENVRAAQRVWGRANAHYGSRYLWTDLPLLPQLDFRPRKMGRMDAKGRMAGNKHISYAQASKIEYAVSLAVCAAVEAFSQ